MAYEFENVVTHRPESAVGESIGVLEAAVPVEQLGDGNELGLAIVAGPERVEHPLAVGRAGRREEIDDRKGALALGEVGTQILAVRRRIAQQVGPIVARLEQGADVEAEADQRIEVGLTREPIRAPRRRGWIVVYQQVLSCTIVR